MLINTWNIVGFFMYGKFSDSTGIKNCGTLQKVRDNNNFVHLSKHKN